MKTPGFPASDCPLLHIVPPRAVPAAAAVSGRRSPLLEDNLLLEQFFGPRASVGTACPEAALMRAVLEDALLCLQGRFVSTGRRGRRLAQEEVLGLDPVAVREALLQNRSSWKSIPLKKIRRSVTAPRALRLHG